MADIFLSYAEEDKGRIAHIIATLERQGWSVWWDRKIPPGKRFDQVIEQALEAARCVVVVWSRWAVESEWVQNEAYEGLQRKILIPILIEEAKIPFAFRRIETARLTGWEGTPTHPELEVLLESIEAVVGPRNVPTEDTSEPAPGATGAAGSAVKIRKATKRKPSAASSVPKAEARTDTKSPKVKGRDNQNTAKKETIASQTSRSGAKRAYVKSDVRLEDEAEELLHSTAEDMLLRGQTLKKSEPRPRAAAKTRRGEAIRSLLRTFLPQNDLFVEPDIPASKLENASASCEVPPDERVLGLIDCTNFGSAKNCLLFGTKGIYFHNDWAGSPSGRHFIPYSNFANREFKSAFFLNVNLGDNLYLDCSACSVPRAKIIDILKRLKPLVS